MTYFFMTVHGYIYLNKGYLDRLRGIKVFSRSYKRIKTKQCFFSQAYINPAFLGCNFLYLVGGIPSLHSFCFSTSFSPFLCFTLNQFSMFNFSLILQHNIYLLLLVLTILLLLLLFSSSIPHIFFALNLATLSVCIFPF